MTKSAISLAVFLVAASSAFGQLDQPSLRSKYGAPLDRETFTLRPGIEMTVDYGPNKLVCKLQLPAGIEMRYLGTTPPVGIITKQQIRELLEEVVPTAIRGKELGRMSPVSPVIGASVPTVTQYEHLSISESPNNDRTGGTIIVAFKDEACPKYDPLNPGKPR